MATNSFKGVLSDTEGFTAWQLPEMGTLASHAQPAAKMPTAEELEAIRQAAYEEGLEQGRQDGVQQGRREALEQARLQLGEQVARLQELYRLIETPLQDLDEEVESSLVHLAIAIARQLVRREIKADPSQIVGVAREAMAVLPVSSRNVTLKLHPEDATLVRSAYESGGTEPGWRIEEDPSLTRGGCRVFSDVSRVDATVESRLASIIAPLLIGERSRELQEQVDD